MLFKFLDTVRSKPKHIRDQYAFGIAIFCTLAIGGVWSLSLPARFAGDSNVASVVNSTNAAPFANLFTQLKNQFSGVAETISESLPATTTPDSIASTTQAALDLQLSTENKDQLRASSTGTKILFGNGTTTSQDTQTSGKPVLVATTSIMVETAR